MSVPVTYHCPHCETVLALERDGYLADKAVTPYPFEGWEYVSPSQPFEDADGVRFVCGESDGVDWNPSVAISPEAAEEREPDEGAKTDDAPASAKGAASAKEPASAGEPDHRRPGCGEPFYLSFVRFEDGREVEPRPETELVELNPDPRSTGPSGPGGPGGGVW